MAQHAYCVTNHCTDLAATDFTWGSGTTTNRLYLVDGRLDKQFVNGSVSTTETLIVDLLSAKSVGFVAVLNSNIASSSSPTLKIQAADNLAFSVGVTTLKDTTNLATSAPNQKDHVLQFSPATKRYIRLTWTWSGSFALRVGEIWLGASTPLTRYSVLESNAGDSEQYYATRTEFDSGEIRGHFLAGPVRSKRVPLLNLSSSEKDEVMAMFRAAKGHTNNLLWIQQYEANASSAAAANQECILGRLEQSGLSWNEFEYERYNVEPATLIIRSLGREVGA